MQAALAEHEHQGGRDAVGTRRADGEHPPVAGAPGGGRHVRREPGAGGEAVQAELVELGLAERVVEQHPGARHRDSRAVAARHGDRAGGAVAVDDRDVGGARARRQAGEAVPVDREQQLVAGHVEVGREVVHLVPVAEHRALDVDDVGPVPVAPALQLAEHHGEHRAAHRRRRVDGEVPLADGAAHRGSHQRGVLGEVEVGDQAAVGRHVVDHRPADLARREHRRALVRDQVEHVGERRVGHHVARDDRRAVGPGDHPERVGVAAEERASP